MNTRFVRNCTYVVLALAATACADPFSPRTNSMVSVTPTVWHEHVGRASVAATPTPAADARIAR